MKAKPRACIFDLDSTLFNADHRLHLIQSEPKNWPEFFRRAVHDKVNEWCYSILRDLREEGVVPLFVTGRGEQDFGITRDSLKLHADSIALLNQNLFMRGATDRRPDTEIKREIYRKQIQPHYDVVLAIDDRKRVVKMWREEGILALRCSDWEEGGEGPQFDKEASKHFNPRTETTLPPPDPVQAHLEAQVTETLREAMRGKTVGEVTPSVVQQVLTEVLEKLKGEGVLISPEIKVKQDEEDPTCFHFSYTPLTEEERKLIQSILSGTLGISMGCLVPTAGWVADTEPLREGEKIPYLSLCQRHPYAEGVAVESRIHQPGPDGKPIMVVACAECRGNG